MDKRWCDAGEKHSHASLEGLGCSQGQHVSLELSRPSGLKEAEVLESECEEVQELVSNVDLHEHDRFGEQIAATEMCTKKIAKPTCRTLKRLKKAGARNRCDERHKGSLGKCERFVNADVDSDWVNGVITVFRKNE